MTLDIKKLFAERVKCVRVLVVGDLMLDRYWFGDVHRISPEAPVPVVKIDRVDDRLGGAGNVARNLSVLGAGVSLLSVIGNDEPGRALQRLLSEEGVDASLYEDLNFDTIVKLRVIGRQQQLLRIDFEKAPSAAILKTKLAEFRQRVLDCDVVIISDYGKGGVTHVAEMIQLARNAGKPVLVDPKGDDYGKYAGANVITPNRSELRQVVGNWSSEVELERKARQLRDDLRIDALLLTRSEEGMTVFSGSPSVAIPAQIREVFDVSGAGDTVIAVLGLILALGIDVVDACRVANVGAGIVVGKLGTAVVTPEELCAAFESLYGR